MATAVPILTYHSLDASGSVISVSPETFRCQMHALSRWGYRGITLAELIDGWHGNGSLPALLKALRERPADAQKVLRKVLGNEVRPPPIRVRVPR